MLWTLAIILAILWLIGAVLRVGNAVHFIWLVIAVVLVIQWVRMRRVD